jgi:probable F420-dependent oxidoreductase
MSIALPELGCYTLAGAPRDTRAMIGEVREAETMGLGSVFVSERFNVKEAATLSGAVAAVSERVGIATAATNHHTRHPVVLGAFATTMHRFTGGRFTLGLGRGIERLMSALGLPAVTTAQLDDIAGLLRRLFRGEVIVGHDGPAGKYPLLVLDTTFDEHIPLGLTAFGPRTLELAGRAYDAVILHTYFTDETTSRCVDTVRTAAERAGRDPASVRVWSCYATIGDHLGDEARLLKTVGRLATYLQAYGDLMVRTNDWDPAVLQRFRSDPLVASFRGAFDQVASTEQLEHVASLLPATWLEPAATGSPEQCARKVLGQFDLGVDGVIMHGASPTELAPVVDAYRTLRPQGRFDDLSMNPGA